MILLTLIRKLSYQEVNEFEIKFNPDSSIKTSFDYVKELPKYVEKVGPC